MWSSRPAKRNLALVVSVRFDPEVVERSSLSVRRRMNIVGMGRESEGGVRRVPVERSSLERSKKVRRGSEASRASGRISCMMDCVISASTGEPGRRTWLTLRSLTAKSRLVVEGQDSGPESWEGSMRRWNSRSGQTSRSGLGSSGWGTKRRMILVVVSLGAEEGGTCRDVKAEGGGETGRSLVGKSPFLRGV